MQARWNVTLLLAGLLGLLSGREADAAEALRLLAAPGYLPGVPVLVRVEALDAAGKPDRLLWDAEAALTVRSGAKAVSAHTVRLWNGMGSILVTIGDEGDLVLEAALGELEASRPLRSLAGAPVTQRSGTLAGNALDWSGVVQVTADTVVPDGSTLRIQPGTLVLLAGVASGEGGADIEVRGALESLGTEAEPVAFTAANSTRPWGQIRHDGAEPSLYRHTFITRAGRAPGEGHTGTGPAVRPRNSRIVFESCTIGDNAGKIMQASGSNLEFRSCLLTRSIMGPEVTGTAILFEESYSLEMHGSDDNDGIYLHGQGSGQDITMRGSVFASGDDDGIDTLNSEVLIEDCIVRDWIGGSDPDSKGISIFGGEVDLRRTLVVRNNIGFSTKDGAAVRIDRSTFARNVKVGVESARKNADDESSQVGVTTSIIHVTDAGGIAVRTDYAVADLRVNYCELSQSWPGTGNSTGDPLFVDLAGNNFHLAAESPCIDAGDPAAEPDPDGTRADMGAFYRPQSGGEPRFARGELNGDTAVDISDPVLLLFHLFQQVEISCEKGADANDDDAVNLADALFLLDFLFLNGAPLPPPAAACGTDATPDSLSCEAPACP